MYVDKHTKLLKLIKDSSSQNKESTVTIYFDDFTSPYAPFAPFAPFVSLENIKHSRDSVLSAIRTPREFHQNYSAARRIFSSFLGVWIS